MIQRLLTCFFEFDIPGINITPDPNKLLIIDTQKCNKTTCIVFDTNVIYYSDRNNHYNDLLIITQINTNNNYMIIQFETKSLLI